jgi:putative flippase GtrA
MRFIGFSAVGAFVLAMGLVVLSFQVEVMGVGEILAGVTTTIFSLEINFLLNKRFNWRDRSGRLISQWWRYHVTRLGGAVINQLLYIVMVSIGINYLLTTLGLTMLITVYNYIGSDRFAFKE